MQATYSKLKTGEWGTRVALEDPFEELPSPGSEIEIKKRNGERAVRKVGDKVWSGETDEGFLVCVYKLLENT